MCDFFCTSKVVQENKDEIRQVLGQNVGFLLGLLNMENLKDWYI